MKRVGNIYHRMYTRENIACAFWKASRGKQHRKEVMGFRQDFPHQAAQLIEEFKTQTLKLGDYRFFQVNDPKSRQICAASFRERVIHHAVMAVCDPILDQSAIFDSYACRKDKGSRRALVRAQQFLEQYPWFLKLDIQKYFDSIDHQTALMLISRKIKDRRVLNLFEKILATYHTRPGKGLPIGNLVSQHLANFYLAGFDHWIKEERKLPYLRYMDDFVVFGRTRQQMKQALSIIQLYLGETLGLVLHPNRQLNQSRLGMTFLGFRVFPGIIRLSSASRRRIIQKCRGYDKQANPSCIEQLAPCLQSMLAATQPAAAEGFRRMLFERFRVLFQEPQPGDPRRFVC